MFPSPPADATRINLASTVEVNYWCQTLNCTETRLRNAVLAVAPPWPRTCRPTCSVENGPAIAAATSTVSLNPSFTRGAYPAAQPRRNPRVPTDLLPRVPCWRAEEFTAHKRLLDPVKHDFALFGAGVGT